MHGSALFISETVTFDPDPAGGLVHRNRWTGTCL
jgi:hypothetical protein